MYKQLYMYMYMRMYTYYMYQYSGALMICIVLNGHLSSDVRIVSSRVHKYIQSCTLVHSVMYIIVSAAVAVKAHINQRALLL